MSKTAIITGAGQGIGEGIAYQLAKMVMPSLLLTSEKIPLI